MLHILHTTQRADGDQACVVSREKMRTLPYLADCDTVILRYTLIVSENVKGKMFRYSMLFILMIAASVSAFSMAPAKVRVVFLVWRVLLYESVNTIVAFFVISAHETTDKVARCPNCR